MPTTLCEAVLKYPAPFLATESRLRSRFSLKLPFASCCLAERNKRKRSLQQASHTHEPAFRSDSRRSRVSRQRRRDGRTHPEFRLVANPRGPAR